LAIVGAGRGLGQISVCRLIAAKGVACGSSRRRPAIGLDDDRLASPEWGEATDSANLLVPCSNGDARLAAGGEAGSRSYWTTARRALGGLGIVLFALEPLEYAPASQDPLLGRDAGERAG
jgi:hypothetical protein